MVATQSFHDQLTPRLLHFVSDPELPPSPRERLGIPTFRPHNSLDASSPPSDRSTPMLPRFSSLLTPRRGYTLDKNFLQHQGTQGQRMETNSRKRSREIPQKLQERERFEGRHEAEDWAPLSLPRGFSSSFLGASAASMRCVVYPDIELKRDAAPVAHGAVSPTEAAGRAPPAFSSHLAQHGYQQTERVMMSHETLERRRLYFNHLNTQKTEEIGAPAEIPMAPCCQYQDSYLGAARKHHKVSRYSRLHMKHVDTQPIYGGDDKMGDISQKRRRIAPLSPTPQLRQPLFGQEYGLTVLETPEPSACLHFPIGMQSTMNEVVPTPRRRYNRSDSQARDETDPPRNARPRLSYNGAGDLPLTSRTSTPADRATPLSPRAPTCVEKCDPPSLTTMVLKSKEFLKSKSLVRNRHDEIDWVATFLNVGFNPSSIYALMCPLRKGRWKVEEENYTLGLLRLIESGTILLRHGQSIRGYIGEKLHSDDMRVLKKLSNCKIFHFAKLINPRLAEEEKLDMNVEGAQEVLDRLEQLKGEFLRSVQLEALVAVRKYLSDSSLRDLLNMRE